MTLRYTRAVIGVSAVSGALLATSLTSAQAAPTTQKPRSGAVSVYTTDLAPLATLGGVKITGGGYGSAVAMKPGSSDVVYGLTDRGPNVDAPSGDDKVEPLPSFTPSIGEFRLDRNGNAVLLKKIPLRDSQGKPYNGQVNPTNSTSETIVDLAGKTLPTSTDGYDSEGLVAMADSTFYVSDEYGPFITHFNARGRQIGRFSPIDGTLPAELRNRVPNKGMEGLTVMPDGGTLVGIMQNPLADGVTTKNAGKDVVTRIVTVNIRTGKSHEYLYVLDSSSTGNSEITALNDHEFLVDERDGAVPSATGDKKLWKIDLDGATDVGPSSTVKGATYTATAANGYLGLTVGGKSLEQLTDGMTTADAVTELKSLGISVAAKPSRPYLDVDKLILSLSPDTGVFDHDKIEGVATPDHGKTLVISNDSDFGIDGSTGTGTDADLPPFTPHAKVSPAGVQDDGQYLVVHIDKLTQ